MKKLIVIFLFLISVCNSQVLWMPSGNTISDTLNYKDDLKAHSHTLIFKKNTIKYFKLDSSIVTNCYEYYGNFNSKAAYYIKCNDTTLVIKDSSATISLLWKEYVYSRKKIQELEDKYNAALGWIDCIVFDNKGKWAAIKNDREFLKRNNTFQKKAGSDVRIDKNYKIGNKSISTK